MDQAISAVIGAIIFTWFTAGLAESIGSIPFILIVALVIGLVGYNTWEMVKEGIQSSKSEKSSK